LPGAAASAAIMRRIKIAGFIVRSVLETRNSLTPDQGAGG